MSDETPIPLVALVGVIGVVLWRTSAPPADVAGADPVPTATKLHAVAPKHRADATFTVVDQKTGDRLGRFLIANNRVYVDSAEPRTVDIRAERHLSAWDAHGLDLGAWGGVGGDGLAAGIRYSPVRIGYGLLAPDLVLGRDAHTLIGAGASLYAPADLLGRPWRGIGLGAWYTVPLVDSGDDRGDPGWRFGLSFTTHH